MNKRVTRAEVPVEQTWNLEDLFPSLAAWEEELNAIEGAVPTVTQFQGRLGEGAATLRDCLNAVEAIQERVYRASTYAGLLAAADGSSPVNQAAYSKAGMAVARIDAALSFVRSEILALPEGTVEAYLAAEPGLADFRNYLEFLLKVRPHQLSAETEYALAALSEVHSTPYTIWQQAKNADMEFPPIRDDKGNEIAMSFALYEDRYEESTDTAMRRKAWDSFVKGLSAYKNTMAGTFAAEVQKNVVISRLRHYDTAAEMLLQPQRVTLDMYNRQLDIIMPELAPHMRRYMKLRKRVLGLDKLLYCDIKAPLDPGYSPEISYKDASDLITEALSIMGPEYSKIIRTALSERWVDRAHNAGKTTGAFCSSPYGAHSYILITWTDAMRGAFTLAHELGHAAHFELANRNQRLVNTDVSLYFVEAPSTINELLLGQRILAKATDPRVRRWVLMQFMGTYHHNFVTHLLEGELQRRIYKLAEAGEPITEETLSTTKGAILSEFWGDTVEIDDGAKLTWMRQPHYYMGLYPYSYSAGLTISTAMAQSIREEGAPAVGRWLEVLKAGSTRDPLGLAKMAGIDMATPDPIRKAVAYVGSIIDELEKSF